MAQLVKARRTNHEPLGGRKGVKGAVIESGEHFLDEESRNAASELLFFIGPKIAIVDQVPTKFIAFGPWLRGFRKRKSGFRKLKPLAEPLNRGATDAAQVALPQSPILRRSNARLPEQREPSAMKKHWHGAEPNFEPTSFLVLI